jgi:puromycin-sensitive aminopeptidase
VDNAVRLLGFFNEYFGTPYPLPKLDHIAVPDFAAGAMENWGAITYRETALLFDPENSAANTRQRILEVVAHEMAHMWFGDLVTMEWWDDLWLNESFATFMGDKAVDNLYPEWNMWTQFVSADTNAGLGLDGLRNSHPIEQRVENPAEIRELFDAISYSKGGAVLRMLEHFLGHDTFREGIRQYIAKHQYGNARTEDLWDALAAASGQPVTEIMNTWIKQTGYPLVTADIQRNGSQASVNLRQERFLYDHLLGEPADETRWQVPVTLIAQGSQEIVPHLMGERSSSLALDAPANGWLKVNAGQTGFYRVSYQSQEWERLRAAVAAKELPAADRLGLQNDAYALMRAGYAPAGLFLSLAEAYVDEDDATVWGDLVSNLRGLENLIIDQPFVDKYRDFARGLLERIVGKVGWDAKPGEGHLDVLRRSIVLGAAGSYGNPSVTAEARRRFDSYQRYPASLHPDLRGLVYGLTAQEGDRSIYDTLWEMERKASLHEEKVRLLGSLTRFQQEDILRETLERSFQPEEVRPQDTPLVIIGVAGNRYGRDLAWDFIKRNWDEVDRRYGRGGFAIMRLVGITGGFTDEARAKEVEEFFREHPAPSANRTIQQSLERIHLNAKWLERNRPELASRFS